MPGGSLQATQLWDGTCNTLIFNDWLERMLCPLLGPEHVVVMDNASFHKSPRTRELIEATGSKLLFLPPYSPDLMPIEGDFGAIKKLWEFREGQTIDEVIKSYQ